MIHKSLSLYSSWLLVIAATILFAGSAVMAGATTNIIYNFTGGTDGGAAYSGLIADKSGNLYGATVGGGATSGLGLGVVFELSPAGAGWTETVLYAFQGGSDGQNPWSGLVMDGAGNLYGATAGGGGSSNCTDACGTVFELSPPSTQGGTWTETVLYRFQGGSGDGSWPSSTLVFDKTGNLYGTTRYGGSTSGYGTVFELSPSAGGGEWTETILHSFQGLDGEFPQVGLVFGKGGALYGTASTGGSRSALAGSIYELVLKGGTWVFHALYAFEGGSDGQGPESQLVVDKLGNLYGTTVGGGSLGFGTVFEVTLPQSGSPLTHTVLYSFQGSADGAYPIGALVFDKSGNLYGTTNGGEGGPQFGGTVYQLAPPGAPGGSWTETVLHLFEGGPQGANPNAGLVFGKAGSLYGTTPSGGADGVGTVFKTVP